jgi:hypothetical protein
VDHGVISTDFSGCPFPNFGPSESFSIDSDVGESSGFALFLLLLPNSVDMVNQQMFAVCVCAFSRLRRVLGFPAKMNGSQRSREVSQQVLVIFTIDVVNHIRSSYPYASPVMPTSLLTTYSIFA